MMSWDSKKTGHSWKEKLKKNNLNIFILSPSEKNDRRSSRGAWKRLSEISLCLWNEIIRSIDSEWLIFPNASLSGKA